MTAKRLAIALALVLLAGIGLWFAFGRATQTAEERITAELAARGLPAPLAGCMGRQLAEQLTLPQLAKLERLRPEPGEAEVPMTVPTFLERLRRVDDPQVIETAATVAAVCTLNHGLGGL